MECNNICNEEKGKSVPFQGELYVGQNIGDCILDNMKVAETEIKIISPYISQAIFDEIRHQKEKLKLITNTRQIDKELIKEFIVTIDGNARKYKGYELIIHRTKTIGVCISVILLLGTYWEAYAGLAAVGVFIMTFIIADILVNKRNEIQVYDYKYERCVDFVYADAGEKDIHSKIYIIDNRIAYICSGNFTFKGMKANFETRICVRDSNAIKILNEKFNRHYNYLEDKWENKLSQVKRENYYGKKKFNDAVYKQYDE